MTEDELNAIEQRANAATPGPWKWAFHRYGEGDYSELRLLYGANPVIESWSGPDSGPDSAGMWASPEDAAFIAHARSDIPALVAEVRRLRAALHQSDARSEVPPASSAVFTVAPADKYGVPHGGHRIGSGGDTSFLGITPTGEIRLDASPTLTSREVPKSTTAVP